MGQDPPGTSSPVQEAPVKLRQDDDRPQPVRAAPSAPLLLCLVVSMPWTFSRKEKKKKSTVFTWFTVVGFTWLYLKIQQFAVLIPKSTTDDTSCHLGSAKADVDIEKLGIDNEFKGDTCWMWSFQVSNKIVSTKESGHWAKEMMYTCKQLKLRQTSYFECSCAVWSFGGVFVSLHVANAISGPAPRGRPSSKLVLSIKL